MVRSPLWCDAHAGQILKPALGLHEALYLWRHRSGVEVVDDEDHHRLAAFQLMQLGQQREPFLVIELVEDLADQRLCLGAFILSPIGTGGSPGSKADRPD